MVVARRMDDSGNVLDQLFLNMQTTDLIPQLLYPRGSQHGTDRIDPLVSFHPVMIRYDMEFFLQ